MDATSLHLKFAVCVTSVQAGCSRVKGFGSRYHIEPDLLKNCTHKCVHFLNFPQKLRKKLNEQNRKTVT